MSASRIRRDQRRTRRAGVRAQSEPRLTPPLREVWNHARWMLANFFALLETPASLAQADCISRAHYIDCSDWIRHLELLTRRLVLAAALALNFILRPVMPSAPRPRRRRRIILWPAKPAAWPARFRMMPRTRSADAPRYLRKPPTSQPAAPPAAMPSFPLAIRLEALRRVLANPNACIRRFAIRMARITDCNTRANETRLFGVRDWDATAPNLTQGRRMIATPMRALHPHICDALDAWNEAAEPD